MRRIKITCPDGLAAHMQVVDAETGEPIKGVVEVRVQSNLHRSGPLAALMTAQLTIVGVQLDLVTDAQVTPLEVQQG